MAYWIMGRSANSRNRVFEPIEGGIRTVAADPAKLEDPHLIIYNAVLHPAGDTPWSPTATRPIRLPNS